MFPRGLIKDYASPLLYFARFLDVMCVIVGGVLATLWVFDTWSAPVNYQIAILMAVLLTLIIFSLFGIYQSWRASSWMHQARIVTIAWGTILSVLIIISYLTQTSVSYSREWIALWSFLSWCFLLFFRLSLHYGLRVMRAKGWNQKRIVIVGAGELGQNVAFNIQRAPWTGYSVVAYIDDDPKLHNTVIDNVTIQGGMEQLESTIINHAVDEVLVALPLSAKNRIQEVLHRLRHSTVSIKFVPDIVGLRLINHSVTEFAGFPVLNLTESPMVGANKAIKAVEDRLIALVIIWIISPLLLAIAIGVKLTSRGSVFYRQERVSWNGKPFIMLKFRSMGENAESHSGPVWANQKENRATRFGRFLRRTSLDELPQFYNVLKGDMSIVGPRPERPYFVDKFKDEIPNYMKKHLVKAGITGWAQVNGWRGDTSLNKRIEYDLYYVENWSLWFDIKIIVLTLFKGFIHQNAH